MRVIKGVVFDMDGVIFDSERLVVLCWQEIAKKYHIANIEAPCRACLGMNREATKQYFLNVYGENFPYDTYKQEMSDLYHSRYSGGRLPLKSGIREILFWLQANKIPVAVASSTRRVVVEAELRDAGLLPYFNQVICGDMVSHSKPDPEIFLTACEKLGVDPTYTIAVEDSYNGIRAAFAAQMIPVMIPDQVPPTEEMQKKAELILENLNDLLVTLQKWLPALS